MSVLVRMKALVEAEREVTEMGTEEEWVNWWNSNNFENPFAGMKMDDFNLLI